MANIEEKVEKLISKTIEDLGYELYDVIYEKEAKDYYLRVFIDTPQGISLDDCEKVNDAIDTLLDEADYIKDQYFLEVSSPGIERMLRKEKHLQSSIGKEITCNLFHPIIIENEEKQKEEVKSQKGKSKIKENSFKHIDGILKDFDANKIVLQVKVENPELQTDIEIDRKNIANLKLKYDWKKGGIKGKWRKQKQMQKQLTAKN